MSALGNSLTFMAPLAAGVAAISGSRSVHFGFKEIEASSVRGPLIAPLPLLVSTVVWTGLAFILPLAFLVVQGVSTIEDGSFPALHIVGLGIGYVSTCIIAFTVGRFAPYWFTPPLIVVVTYMVDFLVANRASGIGNLVPADQRVYDQYSSPSAWADVGRIIWFVSLAGIALVVVSSARASRRSLGASSLVAIMGACAAITVFTTTGADAYGRLHIQWTCGGSSPQICLNPQFSSASNEIRAEVQPIAARLAGTVFQLHRLEQRPRGLGSAPSPGAVAFALDDLEPSSISAVKADVAINALGLDLSACFTEDGQVREGYWFSSILASYVADGSANAFQPVDESSAKAKVQFAQISDVGAWLDSHAVDLRDCSLVLSDFE